jgi:hypothetical protein
MYSNWVSVLSFGHCIQYSTTACARLIRGAVGSVIGLGRYAAVELNVIMKIINYSIKNIF